jgi:EAL domain-containing protein (putative c-di-GMP-specific phosphodiesterase class I)/GGDEF domain-containing protein
MNRSRFNLGKRRLWLAPASAAACALGGWMLAGDRPLLAGFFLAGGIVGVLAGFAEHLAACKLAAQLSGAETGPAKSIHHSLSDLATRLASFEQRLAQCYPVTGLPTREGLVGAVAADLGGETPRLMGAIRFADFDRLAAFDQTAANAALKQFALRLVNAAKQSHVLCQIDRDCFAIWFRGTADLPAATAEFKALVRIAGNEMVTDTGILTPALEMGVVAFPRDGQDAEHLLLRVTAALKRADRTGLGDVLIADPPSVEQARQQYALEQDLAQAIDEDQLTMVFQPVVDLARGRMIGAEALLRWDHPRLGPISPARFIPLVEALGLSDRYGLWVLNAACGEAKQWQDEGLDGLKVAVNLSAKQLMDPGLRLKVERTLQRHGLPPKALELELTETAAMTDADRTFALFTELRAMGVSLAIDDFGAGYSSLSYLKNLPFDKLKIDREFVTHVDQRRDSRAICAALIELGRGLDLLILAEGVESQAEVDVLRDLGCRVFQGYHFSKPLSGEAFRALARDASWLAPLSGAALKSSVPA